MVCTAGMAAGVAVSPYILTPSQQQSVSALDETTSLLSEAGGAPLPILDAVAEAASTSIADTSAVAAVAVIGVDVWAVTAACIACSVIHQLSLRAALTTVPVRTLNQQV